MNYTEMLWKPQTTPRIMTEHFAETNTHPPHLVLFCVRQLVQFNTAQL